MLFGVARLRRCGGATALARDPDPDVDADHGCRGGGELYQRELSP